jgi:hypothetical protein
MSLYRLMLKLAVRIDSEPVLPTCSPHILYTYTHLEILAFGKPDRRVVRRILGQL